MFKKALSLMYQNCSVASRNSTKSTIHTGACSAVKINRSPLGKKIFAAWRSNEMSHNTLCSPENFNSAAISGIGSSFTVVPDFFCNQASDLDR